MSCKNKKDHNHSPSCNHGAVPDKLPRCADFSEVKEQLNFLKQTIEIAVEEDPEYHDDAAPLLEIVQDLKDKIGDYQTRGKLHTKTEIEIMVSVMGLLEFLHEIGIVDEVDDEFDEEFGDEDEEFEDDFEDFDYDDEELEELEDEDSDIADWDEDEEKPKRR